MIWSSLEHTMKVDEVPPLNKQPSNLLKKTLNLCGNWMQYSIHLSNSTHLRAGK